MAFDGETSLNRHSLIPMNFRSFGGIVGAMRRGGLPGLRCLQKQCPHPLGSPHLWALEQPVLIMLTQFPRQASARTNLTLVLDFGANI